MATTSGFDPRPARALLVEHERRSATAYGAPKSESWARAEHFLAIAGTVLIAMRFKVTPQLLTAGDLFALSLLPLWFPVTRRFVGARTLIFLGLLCFPAGLLLSALNSADHEVRMGLGATSTFVMVSLLASVGFLLWAREKLTEGGLVAAFGLGLLLGLSTTSPLFATNPWKYGYALPVTILLLGLAQMTKRRGVELGVVIALGIGSMVADARSAFAILLLTAMLLAWQMRPATQNRKQSAMRAVIGLGVTAVAVYNLGQALILDGLLGPETQARTASQIASTGSLILGGRPEIMATLALMYRTPLGFGSGTIPNYNDVITAKQGMSLINYDPNNGYVENWMFGNGYALHSLFGDLWASYGLVGLALTGFLLVMTLRRLGATLSARMASGALLYASALTLWNVFFAPFHSGLRMLILVLALGLLRRSETDGDPLTRPRRRFRRL